MNGSLKKSGKRNKGFYVALGVCLLAVGAAAWTTYDSVAKYTAPQKPAQSESQKTNRTVSGIPVSEPPAKASSAVLPSKAPAPSAPASSAVRKTEGKPLTFLLPVSGKVTQEFSKKPVFSKTFGDYRAHTGVDLSAAQGETVKSAANGQVEKVFNDTCCGNTVIVNHGDLETWYCGLNKMAVKAGQTVSQGQQIGTVGVDPAESDQGPHLHLIMKKGSQYIDPMSVLK